PRGRGDERDAEEALTAGAESRPRKHDDAFVLHQSVRERRARNAVRQRNPEVHRGLRRLAGESRLTERSDGSIAALAKDLAILREERVPALERSDGGRLHGHELSGVDEARHLRDRLAD